MSVKNTQKIHPIDLKKVQLLVHQIQKILNVDEFAVDIWFCSNNKMRELNNEWRDKSKSTDILSFPVNDVSYFNDNVACKHIVQHSPVLILNLVYFTWRV